MEMTASATFLAFSAAASEAGTAARAASLGRTVPPGHSAAQVVGVVKHVRRPEKVSLPRAWHVADGAKVVPPDKVKE